MALLSTAMRTSMITGDPTYINAFLAGRQTGRWAWPAPARTVRADPAATLDRLDELRRLGIVDDAEFETLRARLRV